MPFQSATYLNAEKAAKALVGGEVKTFERAVQFVELDGTGDDGSGYLTIDFHMACTGFYDPTHTLRVVVYLEDQDVSWIISDAGGSHEVGLRGPGMAHWASFAEVIGDLSRNGRAIPGVDLMNPRELIDTLEEAGDSFQHNPARAWTLIKRAQAHIRLRYEKPSN
jgi:hypothetical protein